MWSERGTSGRGLVQPPLTAADKKVLSSIALEGKRRPEQYVAAGFRHDHVEKERRRRRPSTQRRPEWGVPARPVHRCDGT